MNRDIFIDGYFTRRVLRGEMPPTYKGQSNPPDVGDATMEIECSYLKAFEKQLNV